MWARRLTFLAFHEGGSAGTSFFGGRGLPIFMCLQQEPGFENLPIVNFSDIREHSFHFHDTRGRGRLCTLDCRLFLWFFGLEISHSPKGNLNIKFRVLREIVDRLVSPGVRFFLQELLEL